jgi:hypothetical protein
MLILLKTNITKKFVHYYAKALNAFGLSCILALVAINFQITHKWMVGNTNRIY